MRSPFVCCGGGEANVRTSGAWEAVAVRQRLPTDGVNGLLWRLVCVLQVYEALGATILEVEEVVRLGPIFCPPVRFDVLPHVVPRREELDFTLAPRRESSPSAHRDSIPRLHVFVD